MAAEELHGTTQRIEASNSNFQNSGEKNEGALTRDKFRKKKKKERNDTPRTVLIRKWAI